MTLDGFIASKDGSVGWLDKYSASKEDYGYKAFLDSISTVIMGNTTYKQILGFGEFPYKDKECYVFSRNSKEKDKNVSFVSGDIKKFAEKLDGNIWMLGGAGIFNEFLKHNLVDEFIITVMPELIGGGILLFKENNKNLELLDTKSFTNGVVQLQYKQKN